MYRCLICEKAGKVVEYEKASSLGTHLWKTHDLKPQQYYDQYLAKPGDGKCAECGKPTKFRTIGQGYVEFCSKKCAAKHIAADAERNAHKVSARMETVSKLDAETNGEYSKNILESRKATMVERHGVEFYSQHKDFIDKYHTTNLERYGKESYTQTQEYTEQTKKTNNEKFGVDYWSKNKLHISTDYYNREFEPYKCHVIEHPNKVDLTYKCDICGTEMSDTIFFVNARLRAKITPCSKCFPKRNFRSGAEVNLENFVKSLGVETAHYERGFLGEFGADIVCEAEKVVIEYDGIHWHTDEYHDERYHLAKTEYAEQLGYRMIHVFSDEWEQHEDIVKSRLCQILHRQIPGLSNKVYARQCTVVELTATDSRKFLDKHHIQGYCPDAVRYGLVYQGELVSIMTFGKSRFKANEIELLRFCNALFTNVVGGAGKLFSYYLSHNPIPNDVQLVTFADRRWSIKDSFYAKIGFECIDVTEPNYYYVNAGVRESRMKYQKHKLIEMGYDASKSEREIMESIGMHRIYDCGNYKYIYKKPKVESRPEKS